MLSTPHVGILCSSERGRIRFQRAQFQTPSSVSFVCRHRVAGRELSEFLSAFHLCSKANSPSFLPSETVLSKRYSARFPVLLHSQHRHCESLFAVASAILRPLSTTARDRAVFGKGMRTATSQFSESDGSLNGPDLFTELLFL